MPLPECISAQRIGFYSETDYDEFGELAPITWVCLCGSRRKLEFFDDETEEYVPISEERKTDFLAKHGSCVAPTIEEELFAAFNSSARPEGHVFEVIEF